MTAGVEAGSNRAPATTETCKDQTYANGVDISGIRPPVTS